MLAKAIAGFLQLAAILALLLFLPAWTLHYWQAWTYLAVFLGSSLLISIDLWFRDRQLLERRLKAGPGAEGRKGQNWIQAIASFCFAALLIIPALDHRFGWSGVPVIVTVIGNLLVAVGFLIVYLVFSVEHFYSRDHRSRTRADRRLHRALRRGSPSDVLRRLDSSSRNTFSARFVLGTPGADSDDGGACGAPAR